MYVLVFYILFLNLKKIVSTKLNDWFKCSNKKTRFEYSDFSRSFFVSLWVCNFHFNRVFKIVWI